MILLAPEGAYGDQGITHGAMIGVVKANSGFQQALQEYINSVLQANDYLRQTSGFTRTSIGGRSGYMTELSGRSPVTGRNELVTVYALQLRSGDLFYLDTVVPEDESYRYESAFRNMVSSIRINDR
jgi:hypothetical protein